MKRSLIATSGLAGVALLAAACGSGGGYGASNAPQPTTAPAAAAATPTTLDLANSKLGPILADSQPGSTAGQGLNDNGGLWYVVHPDGTPLSNS